MRILFSVIMMTTLVLSLGACKKLQLQKSFDFDENDHPPVHQPFAMTIWDFMTSHEEFGLMVAAAQKAQLQDIYSGGQDDKTVLLLRNEAMTAFLKDYGYTTIDEVPVEQLQHLLRYHVITARFTQIDLPVQQFVFFQTLVPGQDGQIDVWKWREYWEIRINTGGPDQPPSAKSANVYLHNYEFTNGVGHQLKTYVQWTAY
jgi:hypothetical protein